MRVIVAWDYDDESEIESVRVIRVPDELSDQEATAMCGSIEASAATVTTVEEL